MKKFLFPAVLSLAAAVTLNAAVVATVDGDAISDSDISSLLSAAMPGFDASKLQPNEKKRIIDDLINRKLLLKDAKSSGIEKDVEYIKAVKAAQEGIAVELYMRKLFDSLKVSAKLIIFSELTQTFSPFFFLVRARLEAQKA